MSRYNPQYFTCPQCESRYRLTRVKAGPLTSAQPVHCQHRFRIALLKGMPAMFVGFLGYVEAPDEKAAIEAAVKEFKIAEALRDRIVARRDEL